MTRRLHRDITPAPPRAGMVARRASRRGAVALLALLLVVPVAARAQSNVDPDSTGRRHAWAENAGWANFRANTTHGVRVHAAGFLSGSAWMENLGWVSFGAAAAPPGGAASWSNTSIATYGVNLGAGGRLSGYAWSENAGWIAFLPSGGGAPTASIDPATGMFRGAAWAENLGWLSFDGVPAAWVAAVSADLLPLELSGIVVR